MLVWLESAWPNPVAAAIFQVAELARLLFYLALFFSLWWQWISVFPPASVLAGLILFFLVQFFEILFLDFQAWSWVAQHLVEIGLASFLSECEHCGEDWIACVGHLAGLILGVWWLSGTLT